MPIVRLMLHQPNSTPLLIGAFELPAVPKKGEVFELPVGPGKEPHRLYVMANSVSRESFGSLFEKFEFWAICRPAFPTEHPTLHDVEDEASTVKTIEEDSTGR